MCGGGGFDVCFNKCAWIRTLCTKLWGPSDHLPCTCVQVPPPPRLLPRWQESAVCLCQKLRALKNPTAHRARKEDSVPRTAGKSITSSSPGSPGTWRASGMSRLCKRHCTCQDVGTCRCNTTGPSSTRAGKRTNRNPPPDQRIELVALTPTSARKEVGRQRSITTGTATKKSMNCTSGASTCTFRSNSTCRCNTTIPSPTRAGKRQHNWRINEVNVVHLCKHNKSA